MSAVTVPLFGIHHEPAMDAAAASVMQSRQIAAGAHVAAFEREFGALIGCPQVVTVNDMSNAIQLALRLADVGPGDEVLTTAYACLSSNAPIAMAGAHAVWVDTRPDTGGMDVRALEQAITPRSKAVLLYHPAGYPADVKPIRDLCDAHGLKLIEDCDNALLATQDGTPLGKWGDYAIFSFYPNRQVNATEGGAIACRQPQDAERAKRLRRYGIDLPRFRDKWGEIDPDCDVPEIGLAATLNNLCAAIGRTQLAGVQARIERSRVNATRLMQGLRPGGPLRPVPALPGAVPSYWVLLLLAHQRDAMMHRLKAAGIQCSALHLRNDRYTAFGSTATLPGTQHFSSHVLAVPCGWWLDEAQLEFLSASLRGAS